MIRGESIKMHAKRIEGHMNLSWVTIFSLLSGENAERNYQHTLTETTIIPQKRVSKIERQ